MKVLWVGDAACSSGFARCTHAVCDELHRAGWDVHVLGLNYYGDPHSFPYPIYPCWQPLDGGRDGFGTTRLPRLVAKLNPDVVVVLTDPWNIPEYLKSIRGLPEDMNWPLVVAWLAVDAKNQPGTGFETPLSHVVTWTQFGADELARGGYKGSISVVPLGVDTDIYHPLDSAESREKILPSSIPRDSFIVGVVGRNQPRKRIDLSISYFARWIEQYEVDNAHLLLHVAPTGDLGCNIKSLVEYYGLRNRVSVSLPPVGDGVPEHLLAEIYRTFDVYLTTTQGEGWGLPTLEAMATGVPCVVPDWSGLGEWTTDVAIKVPCTSTALSAPLNAMAHTIGGVPDANATIWALQSLYKDVALRDKCREAGFRLARKYPWSETGTRFRQVLEAVVGVVTAKEATN